MKLKFGLNKVLACPKLSETKKGSFVPPVCYPPPDTEQTPSDSKS